ncbi:MAG: hypothetical protein PHX21_13865 [bacterium]|nr:hypothetical protein [bacterium]
MSSISSGDIEFSVKKINKKVSDCCNAELTKNTFPGETGKICSKCGATVKEKWSVGLTENIDSSIPIEELTAHLEKVKAALATLEPILRQKYLKFVWAVTNEYVTIELETSCIHQACDYLFPTVLIASNFGQMSLSNIFAMTANFVINKPKDNQFPDGQEGK